jgi:hypothetical protein
MAALSARFATIASIRLEPGEGQTVNATRRNLLLATVTLFALLASACVGGREKEADKNDSAAQPSTGSDHVHERGKMLIADAGKHHALLTAHLSPRGNELDIFFETDQHKPVPVAIAVASFKAFARREDGEVKELLFECAPASERPKGEKEGTCSHFVARAPWLKRSEILDLTIPSLKIGSGTFQVQWKGFTPSKYAHHEE